MLDRWSCAQTLLWFPGISCRDNLRPAIDHRTLKLQLLLVSAMTECNASNIGVVNNNNNVHIYILYNITISPVYDDYCLLFTLKIDMIRYWNNIIIQCII